MRWVAYFLTPTYQYTVKPIEASNLDEASEFARQHAEMLRVTGCPITTWFVEKARDEEAS